MLNYCEKSNMNHLQSKTPQRSPADEGKHLRERRQGGVIGTGFTWLFEIKFYLKGILKLQYNYNLKRN